VTNGKRRQPEAERDERVHASPCKTVKADDGPRTRDLRLGKPEDGTSRFRFAKLNLDISGTRM
jgi:hypothetical protein